MARLFFKVEDVKRVVEHSLAAPEQRPMAYTTDKVEAPAVILVHDRGIYLMSNGTPGDPRDPAKPDDSSFVAYATGCNPDQNEDAEGDWWENARALVGGDDFAETLPWARQIKDLIDKGAKRIIVNFGARKISVSAR